MWLDASDATTFTLDGSNNVEQWRDRSGNTRHANQATVMLRPSYVTNLQNGLAGVRFNGSSHFMSGTSFTATEPFSLFCAVRKYGSGSGGGAMHATLYTGATVIGLAVNTFNNTQNGGCIDMTTWRADGTTIANNAVLRQTITKLTGVHTYYRTGGITFSNNVPSTSATTINNYELGRHSGSAYADAAIFEVILYSRQLTTDERNAVHTYLDAKWALP